MPLLAQELGASSAFRRVLNYQKERMSLDKLVLEVLDVEVEHRRRNCG